MTRRMILPFVGLLVVGAACRPASAEEKTLFKKTTPFTILTVTENKGVRTLWFGKAFAPESIVKVGDPDYVEFEYVRAMFTGLALVEEPKRVLMIGLGGGSIPSFLRKHYPKLTIDVVDIDKDVVDVAKKYFGFREDEAMKVFVEDGRKFIEKNKEPYDIIFLDAYGPDNIPYDLATKEFLQAVRKAVKPKGLVVANVWSSSCNPYNAAMLRTYQEVFENLSIVDLWDDANEIFLAVPRKEAIDRDAFARRATKLSKEQKHQFDLGAYVIWGYRDANARHPQARILLDKDKAIKPQE